MACRHCGGTGMVKDTPSHSYSPAVQGWSRCTCQPADPWRPAESLSEVDDYIAARRAAEREIANANR